MIPNSLYFMSYYLGTSKTKWSKIKKNFDLSDSEITYLKDQNKIHREIDRELRSNSSRAKPDSSDPGDDTSTKPKGKKLW